MAHARTGATELMLLEQIAADDLHVGVRDEGMRPRGRSLDARRLEVGAGAGVQLVGPELLQVLVRTQEVLHLRESII